MLLSFCCSYTLLQQESTSYLTPVFELRRALTHRDTRHETQLQSASMDFLSFSDRFFSFIVLVVVRMETKENSDAL